jgi:hypothetical protein
VFIASGMCLGALEVISIWFDFQVSVWGKVGTLALCETFQILFMILDFLDLPL